MRYKRGDRVFFTIECPWFTGQLTGEIISLWPNGKGRGSIAPPVFEYTIWDERNNAWLVAEYRILGRVSEYPELAEYSKEAPCLEYLPRLKTFEATFAAIDAAEKESGRL